MPYKKEDDEDMFEDDFEFVDDDDDDDEEDSDLDEEDDDEEDSEVDEEDEEEAPPAKPKRAVRKTAAPDEPAPAAPRGRGRPVPKGRDKPAGEKLPPALPVDEEEVAEGEEPQPQAVAEPVGPPADYVVHVYELRQFKRTIARDFTSEDADKFAAEYNRTSANHSRWAVSGHREGKPTPKI